MKTLVLITAALVLCVSCQRNARPETALLPPNAPCTADNQCDEGLVCEGCGEDDKICVPGCRSDADCPEKEACQQVRCIQCPCPPVCGRVQEGPIQ